MAFDSRCLDLARVFLGEIQGVKADDISALAQDIQDACEDAARNAETRQEGQPMDETAIFKILADLRSEMLAKGFGDKSHANIDFCGSHDGHRVIVWLHHNGVAEMFPADALATAVADARGWIVAAQPLAPQPVPEVA